MSSLFSKLGTGQSVCGSGLGLSSPSLSAELITSLAFFSFWTILTLGVSPYVFQQWVPILTSISGLFTFPSISLFIWLPIAAASAPCLFPDGAPLILWVRSPPCDFSISLLLCGFLLLSYKVGLNLLPPHLIHDTQTSDSRALDFWTPGPFKDS